MIHYLYPNVPRHDHLVTVVEKNTHVFHGLLEVFNAQIRGEVVFSMASGHVLFCDIDIIPHFKSTIGLLRVHTSQAPKQLLRIC